MADSDPLQSDLQRGRMSAVSDETDIPLDAIVGHDFQNPALLREALSHPSLDLKDSGRRNYQRLEFLGDRVLGLLIAERLYRQDPSALEGDLAVRFNAMVRRETVAEVATAAGLAPHIRLGKSERERGGRKKPAILADVCEAVIGALYIDGGLDAARAFVERHWKDRVAVSVSVEKDAKTRLQELIQARDRKPPKYKVISRTGPDHAPMFTVQVTVSETTSVEGRGGSRREAEQAAAEQMLADLDNDD